MKNVGNSISQYKCENHAVVVSFIQFSLILFEIGLDLQFLLISQVFICLRVKRDEQF